MGKSMMGEQALLQFGDGPWLVKMGPYAWDVLVRVDGDTGRALEVVARRAGVVVTNAHPVEADWWSHDKQFTIQRKPWPPQAFGTMGIAARFRESPQTELPSGAPADDTEWRVGQSVIVRRVVLEGKTCMRSSIPPGGDAMEVTVGKGEFPEDSREGTWQIERGLSC